MTTILILDDNPTVLQMLGLVLRANGAYRILEASTELEAVTQLEQRSGEIDVLVADVCIDDRPGRAVADRLTTLCPHLRVLFISGYPKDHLLGNGWLRPGDAFLSQAFHAGSTDAARGGGSGTILRRAGWECDRGTDGVRRRRGLKTASLKPAAARRGVCR